MEFDDVIGTEMLPCCKASKASARESDEVRPPQDLADISGFGVVDINRVGEARGIGIPILGVDRCGVLDAPLADGVSILKKA